MQSTERIGVFAAIIAAILFGLVIPFSKLLLNGTGPVTLAALLYLGAGLGLALMTRMFRQTNTRIEAGVCREDIPWILIILLAGSIIGPILLMTGLSSVPAGTASLLLNGELIMTAVIAGIFFAEPLGKRTLLAATLILAGGLIISLHPGDRFGISSGAVLILGACICWGIDNNVTRLLSGRDPAGIGIIKGFGAGLFGLVLAAVIGEPVPDSSIILSALFIGWIGYGLSIFLFIRSLRVLGAVRTGSLFALAPFIGVIASYPVLGEIPGIQTLICLPLMAGGVYLIATEQHTHPHTHTPVCHDHRHTHSDEHHSHDHGGVTEEHAHIHQHEPVIHDHHHTPDLHHHHGHEDETIGKTAEEDEIV